MEDYLKEADKVSLDEEVIGLYNLEELRENQMYASRETGYNEGLEQGSLEEKKSIAKKLLDMSMTIKEISKVTGLNQKEINTLKKDL